MKHHRPTLCILSCLEKRKKKEVKKLPHPLTSRFLKIHQPNSQTPKTTYSSICSRIAISAKPHTCSKQKSLVNVL
jgi:hypothetical protein